MILPYCCAFIRGTTCFTIRNGPRRLNRHDPIPECRIDFGALRLMEDGEQSRIIDKDVDLTETLDGSSDQRRHRGFITDIGHCARRRIGAVIARDLIHHLVPVDHVGNHQPRAFGSQRSRIVPADTFGPAGDNGDPTVQTSHNCFPFVISY